MGTDLLVLAVLAMTSCVASDGAPVRAWSADAAEFLFTSQRDGNGEVYLGRVGDSAPVNLSNHPGFDGFASWAPEGGRIVFDSDRVGAGNREVFVMALADRVARRLTDHPGFDFVPAWSPDGEWIAFVSTRDSDFDPALRNFDAFRGQIYRIRPDGRDLQRVTHSSAHDQAPAWTPEGDIVFCRDDAGAGSLWVVGADGADPRLLVDTPAFECSPTIDPTGRSIAFRVTDADSARVRVGLRDGDHRVLTMPGKNQYEPSFSPDGEWLCVTIETIETGEGVFDLFLVPLDGRPALPLTTHPGRDQSCALRPGTGMP